MYVSSVPGNTIYVDTDETLPPPPPDTRHENSNTSRTQTVHTPEVKKHSWGDSTA